jgi:phage baseplate assembly protein W
MSVVAKDLDEDTFIGLELPLNYGNSGFFNRTKTALQQSISNIKNLLLTNKGERLGNPTFGSELLSVIFEQENTDIESRVEETIRSSMSEFLPFINVVNIQTNFSETNKNVLSVGIKFTLNVDETSEADLTLDLSNYNSD